MASVWDASFTGTGKQNVAGRTWSIESKSTHMTSHESPHWTADRDIAAFTWLMEDKENIYRRVGMFWTIMTGNHIAEMVDTKPLLRLHTNRDFMKAEIKA